MPRPLDDNEIDNINLLALQHDYVGARKALFEASQSPSDLSEAVNQLSAYGYPLLHSVVEIDPVYGPLSAQQREDQIHFLRDLLNIRGVDPDAKDQEGLGPLVRAMYYCNTEAMQLFVDHGAKWYLKGKTPVQFSDRVPLPDGYGDMSPEQQNKWKASMRKAVAIAEDSLTTRLCSANTLPQWLW
tara:strand:+ start:267 stop:821 length:555 start_codon:yes stop_codon:yes gene_type:complete